MEQLIYNVARRINWWQVRKNLENQKYVFVLLKLGKWTTDNNADPDEIQETWIEIIREYYDDLKEAGDKMIDSIVMYNTKITGHGY